MKNPLSSDKKTSVAAPAATVSKKFRNYIVVRIAEASRIAPDLNPFEALDAIDSYIAGGMTPDNLSDAPLTLRLVFALLRPEIDRAIARSGAARERARRRQDSGTATAGTTGQKEPQKQPLTAGPNRRDRRLREQKARRANKRRLVPLSTAVPRSATTNAVTFAEYDSLRPRNVGKNH